MREKRRTGRCKGKVHHALRYFGGAVCVCRTAMSHHSDEQALLTVASDSFWEPGNYKRTTRRIDDGHRLCGELQALVQERADIEKTYAKSLRGWGKKWNDLIEKGPEYGTMEAAWKGGMVEAERLSDLHLSVRDRLVNDVIAQIKNWQKDTYHKSMIQLKERKEMDEAFKKAQKPWAKLLQKVERTRLEYHTACKQERTAQNQERNASGDSSLSPDQEYTEEFRDIAKGKSKESLPTGPITLLNQRPVSEDELPPISSNKSAKNANHTDQVGHNSAANNSVANNSVTNNSNNTSANNTIDKKSISAPIAVTNGTASAPKSAKTSPGKDSGRQDNPFEEEEWDEESGGALTDTGEPGVPVRALYDYTGAESDELSFRQGDLFEKLEDEDEQGWCKGRKDGRVGLYPANYVEPVGH
ncbi:unnamed protein product, partial [Iphiclides podalirius]